jgi:hypothetical protein
MASEYWIGGTTAVAQVWKGTVTTTTNGHTYILTVTDLNDASTFAVTYVVANPPDTTVTLVATGIITAWNASTSALLTGITATQSSGQVILTADTAGVPFSVAATGTGTWSGTGNTTSNAGPNDYGTAANFSGAAVPSSTDNLVVDARGGSNSILYNLNQSAVTLTSLTIYQGAPAIGSTSYALKISATTCDINVNPNDGTSPTVALVNLNFGTNATTCTVFASGNTGSSGLPPVVLAGSHASNVLIHNAGTVGVGVLSPGQSGNFPTITSKSGTLTIGSGTTWTTFTNNGGTITSYVGSSSGTFTNYAGTATFDAAAKVGTLKCIGGTVKYNTRITGDDVGILYMDGGTFDASGDSAAFTATSVTQVRGGTIKLYSTGQFSITTPASNVYDFTYGSTLSVAA